MGFAEDLVTAGVFVDFDVLVALVVFWAVVFAVLAIFCGCANSWWMIFVVFAVGWVVQYHLPLAKDHDCPSGALA